MKDLLRYGAILCYAIAVYANELVPIVCSGSITLDSFRGIVFCGGFSYADVNDSAKGE
jgi:phosphoribosylformylglycinamidine (FGAM) synthase-like amidotransferase family enzyme